MSLLTDLTALQIRQGTLTDNKVANFAYNADAYDNDDADGVEEYDFANDNNIPVADPDVITTAQVVLDKGFRSQAASIARMLINHFFGRVSYNLNKVVDVVDSFITTVKENLGEANGIATLDENGKVPEEQLPESSGGSSAPIGSIQASSVDLSNDGYILCDGRAISRTDYAELFAKVGTTFGSGDGSTTFNVPDLRDKFIEGAGTNALGTVKTAGLPNITGTASFRRYDDDGHAIQSTGGVFSRNDDTGSNWGTAWNTTAGNIKNNVLSFNANKSNSIYKDDCNTVQPPAVCLYYFVKARNISQQEVQDAIDDNIITESNVFSAHKVDSDYANGKKTILTQATDLNTLVNDGIYVTRTDDIGDACTNRPTATHIYSFVLEVVRRDSLRIFQFLKTNSNSYFRSYDNTSGWTVWYRCMRDTDMMKFSDSITVGAGQKSAIEATFNATANYSKFELASSAGEEALWIGYRHSTYGQGIRLTRGHLQFFTINTSGLQQVRDIMYIPIP